ncbi:polysaccharide deacetylase (plasmid) [Cellulomonas sp. WB94]|uniref:polysaccharide deacetylase family protein n=1 Tax=Cellulomonas sp. WB94 TaxID=2173174 RepID=UPI000D583529|nr:polysaccharide deacetylase family protein [Cellulomonas sp. WB94]PVU81449.1 polysaccharide deacetylase [Cellulomonas sp. WB94]
MRRRRASVVVVLAFLLLAAGCGGPDEAPRPTTASPTSTVAPSPRPSASDDEPASPPAAATTPAATRTAAPPSTAQPSVPAPAPPAPAPAPATPSPPAPDTHVPTALLGTDWERLPTTDRVVALTFDSGSSDSAVASILSTLATEHVSATFFVTGDFARRYPGQVAAIASAGHRVGNHSDSHEHYPALTDAQISDDLGHAEAAIVAAGATAAPWFRFPYGDRTSGDIRAVNAAGYVPVPWTVDTLGWKGTSGGQTKATVVQRTLGAAQPGEIVLMHVGANPDDGTILDAHALPEVIARLRAAGYSFVTVDRLRG